jgi:phospholipid/cholesterol/gamma-HCH transport system permease protein
MVWALASIGRVSLDFLASTGRLTLFLVNSLIQGLQPPYYMRQILRQFWEIG